MPRRLALVAALATIASLAGCASAFGATYYVSPGGSDSAAGTSQASAWRTVGRVDNAALQPGDNVLFEGGATFGDSSLMPGRSGTASSPITFGSYGSGQATIANAKGAVWLSGVSWLVFDNLRLSGAGSGSNVFGGDSSAPSTHITLSNSTVTGTTGVGVIAPGRGDAYWTISGSTITHTGDTGLIMFGGPHTITRNTVAYTGENASITWARHGIYAKGPDQTISYNDFSYNNGGQAISLRFHGARVFGNTVHDTRTGIGFFDYDTGAAPQGTSYVYANRLWNLASWGFYYSGDADPQGHAPTVDFVLASNTFSFAGAAEAINVSESGSAHVTFVNNAVIGSYGSAYRGAPTSVESHNLWNGASSNVPSGAGDLRTAAQLTSSPDFAPNSGSPVVDAGTTSAGGLAYSASCDGTALSYCAGAPDIGAVETAAVASVPLGAPTALIASSIAQTGVTLSWTASADPRTTGYEILKNGSVVATSALPIATVGGLTCGTGYTFAVRATGSAPTSASISTAVTTAACTAAPTTTTTPTTTTIGSYTTATPKQNGKKLRTLQTAPSSGSVVKSRFLVVARVPATAKAVSFVLDGRAACVDRAAPFVCALNARPGAHIVRVRQPSGATSVLRLRVAG